MVKINLEVKKKSLFLWATAFLILAGFVGVYAFANAATGVGHNYNELQGCADNQILKWTTAGGWGCVALPVSGITTELDPQVGAITTSGKWCTTDGSKINCEQATPSGGGGFWSAQGDNLDVDGIYYTDGLYSLLADESQKGVGIGYKNTGNYKLAVHGIIYADKGIKLGNSYYDGCDESRAGILTYLVQCLNNEHFHSYLRVCMQTGETSYSWFNIKDQDLLVDCNDGDPLPSGGGCFLSGTKVRMADESLKNIEEIKQGEFVLSFDEVKQEFVASKVGKLLIHTKENTNNWENGYFVLETENGEKVNVTGNHLIYNYEKKEYIRVDELNLGDSVRIFKDNQIILSKVNSLKYYPAKLNVVYNLELGEPHNYFAEGILVHNEKLVDPTEPTG